MTQLCEDLSLGFGNIFIIIVFDFIITIIRCNFYVNIVHGSVYLEARKIVRRNTCLYFKLLNPLTIVSVGICTRVVNFGRMFQILPPMGNFLMDIHRSHTQDFGLRLVVDISGDVAIFFTCKVTSTFSLKDLKSSFSGLY